MPLSEATAELKLVPESWYEVAKTSSARPPPDPAAPGQRRAAGGRAAGRSSDAPRRGPRARSRASERFAQARSRMTRVGRAASSRRAAVARSRASPRSPCRVAAAARAARPATRAPRGEATVKSSSTPRRCVAAALEPSRGRVGELGVGDAASVRAGGLLDQPGPLEPVEQPRDPGGGQHDALGQVDAAHHAVVGVREPQQHLVVVERQPVRGQQVGVELAGDRRVGAQKRNPRLEPAGCCGCRWHLYPSVTRLPTSRPPSRPPARGTGPAPQWESQASRPAVSALISPGSSPRTMSARVTASSTRRRLARTAIHTSASGSPEPL